jgi:isopentenyldiphosphate isomerase
MIEEIMDVVDEHDTVIGTSTKSDVYKHHSLHRIVHVFVFNEAREMALQLRSKEVSFCPHHWCTAVAGHVIQGESYEQAAMREYEEELGITSTLTNFRKDFYQPTSDISKFLGTFETTYNGSFSPDLSVVERVEFFSLTMIRDMIQQGEKFHPELLFLLQKYYL